MIHAGSLRRASALLIFFVLPQGCVYLNSVYNAKRVFGDAEKARWAGQDTSLQAMYGDVVDKAMRAYAADPGGKWADDALYLTGLAHLRLGEWEDSRTALASTASLTTDSVLNASARMYLGAVEVAAGELESGLEFLDEALGDVTEKRVRGEGYLWRARALLQLGRIELGWADLDLAAESDDRYRVPADLERLIWGVRYDDTARAFRGLQGLMRRSGARQFGDSIRFLVEGAADEWGPSVAVGLLARAESAPWSRTERDRLLMQRAYLSRAAGDTTQAIADALRVGGGVGPIADSARVTVAGWRLEVSQLGQLAEIRSLLLPAVSSVRAREIVNSIRRVGLLVDRGLEGDRLGFFAAAQEARDVLRANIIAVGLFQAYADFDPESPWVGKALLSALPLTADTANQAAIEDRLRALPADAYVGYARRGVRDGSLGLLEVELQRMLNSLLAAMEADLVQRRLLVSDPARPDTTTAPPR
ncbi:MAG: tol-pal system YbgF family protein [Longimicrobiales bacterium]